MKTTKTRMANLGYPVFGNGMEDGLSETAIRKAWMDSVVSRLMLKDSTKALAEYGDKAFYYTRSWIKGTLKYPQYAQGFQALAEMRLRAFYTTKFLIQIKKVSSEWDHRCPFCDNLSDESCNDSIGCILGSCTRWEGFRRQAGLRQYIDAIQRHNGGIEVNIPDIILGGNGVAEHRLLFLSNVRRNLRREKWRELEVPYTDSMRNDGFLVQGVSQEVFERGYVLAARFLQLIMPTRRAVLADLSREVSEQVVDSLILPRAEAADNAVGLEPIGPEDHG